VWDDLDETKAFRIGLDALDLTFAELVLHLGQPVDVQRKLEIRARARRRVDDPMLPGPRSRAPRPPRRRRRGHRQLQGQDDGSPGPKPTSAWAPTSRRAVGLRRPPRWKCAPRYWPHYMVCGAAPGSERWFSARMYRTSKGPAARTFPRVGIPPVLLCDWDDPRGRDHPRGRLRRNGGLHRPLARRARASHARHGGGAERPREHG
jgi:hypothetical protein